MLNRIQIREDEEGVSEVVGSILTLIVTVTLFSSIFIGVQSLQPPDKGNYVDFSATMEDNNDLFINITNEGDGVLTRSTRIHVMNEDAKTYFFSFSDDVSGGDLTDNKWKLGETLNIEIPSSSATYTDLTTGSDSLELVIVDGSKNSVIWREMIKNKDDSPPIVQDYGVKYPLEWDRYALPKDQVTFWADVIDKDTTSELDITVDLNKLESFNGSHEMKIDGDYKQKDTNTYKLKTKIDMNQDNGTYLLKLNASDGTHNITETYYFVLHIGMYSFSEDANLKVDANKFRFSPDSPQNGQKFSITSTVYNDGGLPTTADIEFWDMYPNGTSKLMETKRVSFPAGGGRDISANWKIMESGLHTIIVRATNVTNGRGGEGSRNLTVSPTILVVDDDGASNGPGSEATTMINALDASDFRYELTRVHGENGPAYDTGPNPLNEYDIVIWLTGSQTSGTLSVNDRDNLEKFLQDGNKLWLIGEGIGNENPVANWVSSHLHLSFTNIDAQASSPMRGNDIPFDSSDRFHFDESMTSNSDRITKITSSPDIYNSLIDDTNNEYMVSYESSTPGGRRTVFQPFLFSALNESITGSRSRLAFKVIMWLGNITEKSGKDLAISSQDIDNLAPNFMDTLTIDATIRNNGWENETTEAVLEVDDVIVDQTEPFDIDGENTTSIEFKWLADELGKHQIRIIVDPFDKIEETNELNNDISYQGEVTEINVEFTTLIVDDDEEDDHSDNSTYYVKEAYDRLNYTYDMHYVNSGDQGPLVDKMKFYNSICWVTGSLSDPFVDDDLDNITRFLNEYRSNIVFVGDKSLNDIPHDFKENMMRIDAGSGGTSVPPVLHGIKNDPITHGFEYQLSESWSVSPNHYELLNDGQPIFKDGLNNYYSHRYENTTSDYKMVYLGIDPIHFKQSCPDSELRWYDEYNMDIGDDPMREELFFKINNWFGLRDDRVELRVSDIDVEVSSEHPTLVIGSSFVIRAKIQNIGGTGTEALIRFKDGTTHIETESIFVPAHGSQTIEVKWKPVHAGEDRPIRVIVDPIKEVGEIPNEPNTNSEDDHLNFNNQAVTYTDVFYFWDDMENGTANWRHETNLALINGETPLDYMGGEYEDLDTDIAGNWSSKSGVKRVTWDSHSEPSSYFMEEPTGPIGRKADSMVALVIDDSRSMYTREVDNPGTTEDYDNDGIISPLDKAKEAAKVLISKLSNRSVVSIFHFDGDIEVQALPWTSLENSGRDTVNNAIEDLENPSGQTVIWDSIGLAYDSINENKSKYPDLGPATVVLSDGADYKSSDTSAVKTHQLEGSSNSWCPWHNMYVGNNPSNNFRRESYNYHYGKYSIPWDNIPGEWYKAGTYGGSFYKGNRRGLLHSDVPIFTIGLALEHHNPPFEPTTDTWYEGQNDPGNSAVYTGSNSHHSGTVEFNLWEIANTSDAKYFYAPTSDDLEDIFIEIGGLLAKPGNVSSVDIIDNGTSIKSWDNPNPNDVENKDKWVVTPMIDISNMDSAFLTFWHKYKIISGVNGAYMEIGFENSTGWHEWRYIKPSIGPYSGNLYLEGNLPVDMDDNTIRWCWNGRSADGTLDWEYVKVDILNHVPTDTESFKLRFYYKQYGGSNEPGGWLIDDVSITATRKGDQYYSVSSGQMDVWHYVTDNGNKVWWNGINYDEDDEQFRGGIDNRLITSGVDLTNAETATLSADFKFNINDLPGRPPDGFRVEITTDNGITWESITLGSRAASGLSGGWVQAEDLYRLLLDLSDYSGETIMLRFRVVTNNAQDHYYDLDADYGGFYVDNVIISGETI